MYDRLFEEEDPYDVPEGGDFVDNLNPDSLEIIENAYVEPSLAQAAPGERYQFERQGYFCVDPDSVEDKLVFNLTVSMRDTWARRQRQKNK
jgi:glutaminyl-tRNA synthetase